MENEKIKEKTDKLRTQMEAAVEREDYEVARVLRDEIASISGRAKAPADLNDDQAAAFDRMMEFMEDPGGPMFLLQGFAGTGKSYLINRFVESLVQSGKVSKVAVTAPTNKAVKVLVSSNKLKSRSVHFMTVHKLLNLKEQITDDGQVLFTRQTFGEQFAIEEFDLVVVDEVSMLQDDLFDDLQKHSGHVKFVFMGDPAQIPPIGLEDSIPLVPEKRDRYRIEHAKLDRIMRQAKGNPIIETSFEIRDDLGAWTHDLPAHDVLDESGNGVYYVGMGAADGKEKMMALLEKYFKCDEFKNDADWAKVIAWRNRTVDGMNNIIRSIIYGTTDLPRIMEGEKMVAMKPIVGDYNTVVFSNNDEFTVIDYLIRSRTFATDNEAKRLRFYATRVEYVDPFGKRVTKTIDILHEDSYADHRAVSEYLKNVALSCRGANKTWLKYYDFLKVFADVGYNYSGTIHKGQGSTYQHVFVIEDDIDANRNVYERNRIRYTAYTRAARRLYRVRR